MNKHGEISMSVIRRLPRYYRFLTDLKNSGITRTSSKELSQKMGLTASQIRQDLNCFGGFGQQGYGYDVVQLASEIGNILGLYNNYNTILIGAGNLGKSIANHISFNSKGFNLIGIFDEDKNIIGKTINNIKVCSIENLEDFCKKNNVNTVILCVSKEAAYNIIEKTYHLGIKNYWNFSHYDISLKYNDTIVENVHINDSLMTLCYRISNNIDSI